MRRNNTTYYQQFKFNVMKKVLFLAVIAASFMACNLTNNEPVEVSNKDKDAAAAISTNAPSMIGQDSKTVAQNLTNAGFVKISKASLPELNSNAPKRVIARMAEQNTDEATFEYYIYGAPKNIESMTEAQAIAAVIESIKSGKAMIQASVAYTDGTVAAVASGFIAPAAKNNATLYTKASDALYKEINKRNSDAVRWEGTIYDKNANATEGGKTYTDHGSFVAGISAFTTMEANESGQTIVSENSTEGLYYEGIWYYPSEEEVEKITIGGIGGIVAFVTGGTIFANQPIETLFK